METAPLDWSHSHASICDRGRRFSSTLPYKAISRILSSPHIWYLPTSSSLTLADIRLYRCQLMVSEFPWVSGRSQQQQTTSWHSSCSALLSEEEDEDYHFHFLSTSCQKRCITASRCALREFSTFGQDGIDNGVQVACDKMLFDYEWTGEMITRWQKQQWCDRRGDAGNLSVQGNLATIRPTILGSEMVFFLSVAR